MKPFSLFLIWIVPVVALSQSVKQPIYVWAKNGLTMRESPSKQSKKIKTLPYGTLVVITQYSEEDSIIIIPAYKRPNEPLSRPVYLRGSWVQACYERDTGYLFSGYLSNMAPYKPELQKEQRAPASIIAWILQHEKILDTQDVQKFQSYNTTVYSNHVITRYLSTEGSSSIKYIFPYSRDFQDGFLLLNYFSNLTFEKTDLEQCEMLQIESRPSYLQFESIGLEGRIFWMFSIYFDGEMLVIEEGRGC